MISIPGNRHGAPSDGREAPTERFPLPFPVTVMWIEHVIPFPSRSELSWYWANPTCPFSTLLKRSTKLSSAKCQFAISLLWDRLRFKTLTFCTGSLHCYRYGHRVRCKLPQRQAHFIRGISSLISYFMYCWVKMDCIIDWRNAPLSHPPHRKVSHCQLIH